MKRNCICLFIAALLLIACTNHRTGNKNVDPESIYFSYRVWGDEDGGIVTVKLQYLFGGPNGTGLLLDGYGKVEIDGEIIEADSSAFSGAYYEVIRALDEFTGKHVIVFTDKNGKKYRDEFEFPVVSLETELPAIIKRDDIILELSGLKSNDRVRLLLTDTSFYGRGIEKIDTVKDGQVIITKDELNNLRNGPVHLELSCEEERIPKETTHEGGRFSISYSIKREFMLEDFTPIP